MVKITKIEIWQIDLPLVDGPYRWSSGKEVTCFDTTVVKVSTDSEGIFGWGEACPLGAYYLPSYPNGVRTGLRELGPHLMGQDPTKLKQLNAFMDYVLKGHPYVKSAVDVACWDITGKVAGLPVVTLLGGRTAEPITLYRAISLRPPLEMAANAVEYLKDGYTKFQLKVGRCVEDDIARIKACRAALPPHCQIACDANTGWSQYDAMRVVAAVKDLDVAIEQPCESYEECLRIRTHTNLPFILDESISDIRSVMRAATDGACDVVNLKISKLGGLTKLALARDLCVELGIAMTIEDTWGGDIVTAAIAAAAHSTPHKLLYSATDFNSYVTIHFAEGAPRRENGHMVTNDEPGLGIRVREDMLGKPLLTITPEGIFERGAA